MRIFENINNATMKKLILSSIFCAVLIGATAQSVSFIDPVTLVQGTLAEIGSGELEAGWDVQNITDGAVGIRARRNVIQSVPGSVNYFCWGVCFSESVNVSPVQVTQTLGAQEINSSFYGHYRPNGNAGQTIIEYCFFNNNNPSDELCQTVNYCVEGACLVGVDENMSGKPAFSKISPNPVSGIGSITYSMISNPENARVRIYGAMGELVRDSNLTAQNGMIIFHADDFANGIYIVVLEDNGLVVDTQRLVIAK
jgi:hypothetical protein